MFTTENVADQLLAFLREGRNVDAIAALYAEDIHTEEANSPMTRGGKAVVLKSMQGFTDAHDFHYTHIEGPLVSGNHFALRLRYEAKNHESGGTFAVDEIGVYTVRDGKIAREQFFYEY